MNITKIKYIIIFVILLIIGNFLRLFIEDNNIPKIKVNSKVNYNKEEAKNQNDLSKTINKYDINIVSYEELIRMGFSKSKATKIIEFRDKMGLLSSLEELKNIKRFGNSSVKQATKYLFVDSEKLENIQKYYNDKSYTKFNINKLDEDGLKLVGFDKKEIKKILKETKNNSIRSNVDLEKIIGSSRYEELEKRIKFID